MDEKGSVDLTSVDQKEINVAKIELPLAPSLDLAIRVALMVGPLSGAVDRANLNVKRFLLSKFNDVLNKNPESYPYLQDAWNAIFGETSTTTFQLENHEEKK